MFLLSQALPTSGQDQVIEGSVTKDEVTSFQSGISKEHYKNMDVQLLSAGFYYYPEAEVNFEILKREAQRGHPHLMSYRELEGLYRKAKAETTFESELTEWRYQGGPSPLYIKAGTKLRNNGDGAITDVKLIFNFEVKAATLRANGSTLTTDYSDLQRNSKWQPWITKTVNIAMLPPGEYRIIYTDDLSIASMLENLNSKWPETIRVKVNAYAAVDSIKKNNYAFKSLQMIPDHFVIKVIH
jgi:hypothetical protein